MDCLLNTVTNDNGDEYKQYIKKKLLKTNIENEKN